MDMGFEQIDDEIVTLPIINGAQPPGSLTKHKPYLRLIEVTEHEMYGIRENYHLIREKAFQKTAPCLQTYAHSENTRRVLLMNKEVIRLNQFRGKAPDFRTMRDHKTEEEREAADTYYAWVLSGRMTKAVNEREVVNGWSNSKQRESQ